MSKIMRNKTDLGSAQGIGLGGWRSPLCVALGAGVGGSNRWLGGRIYYSVVNGVVGALGERIYDGVT